MSRNILLAGVGGQGTVLASKLLAHCAVTKGEFVRTAETIGMAQRGGCVTSHVRIGDDVYSPLIPVGSADLVIAFEPAEAVRSFVYLREGGSVVTASRAIKPVTDALSGGSYSANTMLDWLREHAARLIILDADQVTAVSGSSKSLNVALLGAAAATGELGCSQDELLDAIKVLTKPAFYEMNRKAVEYGASLYS